ncbi:MAG: hypothetical protein K5669_09550 [Lachnospiraceae bacterium]|nr:hypothetical protein [Lachnospiraceae bacterium]
MAEKYFDKALSNFTNDFASGGAIRHLADKGFTVKEIHDRLDFPTPVSKISETVWNHFLEEGIILLEDPLTGTSKGKVRFEKVQNKYGKTSFKRVTETVENQDAKYIKCEFGKFIYKDKKGFEESLMILDKRDREYIMGLPWPIGPVWHIADERMTRIENAMETEQGSDKI